MGVHLENRGLRRAASPTSFASGSDISEFFDITCPACGHVHQYGDESTLYDYELRDLRNNSSLRTGRFSILHDDYIAEATEFKYCIVCCTLKPLRLFDRHASRRSQRQGECRLCKTVYNRLKNPTRTADQHREAAQKRRLYMEMTGASRIDSQKIYQRFSYRCFKCGHDLSHDIQAQSAPRAGNLDHTLPAKFLWPLTTDNATLLCQHHNAEKAEQWPSAFYSDEEIKRLVTLTGIPYATLTDPPHYNPVAIEKLHDPAFVGRLLAKYAAYMPEMITIRNRILTATDFDLFAVSPSLSRTWIDRADQELRR